MLRPAVPHLGGEKTPVSRHILTDDTVSISDENTGPFQVKSNSNSVPNFSNNYYAEISKNKLRNQLGHIRKDRLMSI